MKIQVPPRRVQSVVVSDITYYVRALYVPEVFTLEASMEKAEPVEGLAIQLSGYLCDSAGADLLNVEEAKEVVAALEPRDLKALIKAGQTLNSFSEEAVEEARKNS